MEDLDNLNNTDVHETNFSRSESVVLYTSSVLFSIILLYILYRVLLIAWEKLLLKIRPQTSESSDSIDSLEEPLKKKSKLKVKIKPKVCKTGTKVKKKKKKKKFSTFCTECKTNEETLQKLVIHVNKWHKVSSMKVRLDFLVTF